MMSCPQPFSRQDRPYNRDSGAQCRDSVKFRTNDFLMTRTILFAACFLLFLEAGSQYVGVGTATPTEMLDVNGNLNIQGNLKVDGVAGQSGQVLRTNAGGNTEWGDLTEYKNHVAYSQNGTWNIPVGVHKVMIELWGAGGGGAYGGGGGSGAYVRAANIPVVPGNSITVEVSLGGQGATSAGGNGANGPDTKVTVNAGVLWFNAKGGAGATPAGPGNNFNFALIGIPYYIQVNGNNGSPTTESYQQRNATDYVTVTKYGDGGKAAMLNAGEGKGGFRIMDNGSSLTLKSYNSNTGTGPGAGGGGGYGDYFAGSRGAPGMVIIHY